MRIKTVKICPISFVHCCVSIHCSTPQTTDKLGPSKIAALLKHYIFDNNSIHYGIMVSSSFWSYETVQLPLMFWKWWTMVGRFTIGWNPTKVNSTLLFEPLELKIKVYTWVTFFHRVGTVERIHYKTCVQIYMYMAGCTSLLLWI